MIWIAENTLGSGQQTLAPEDAQTDGKRICELVSIGVHLPHRGVIDSHLWAGGGLEDDGSSIKSPRPQWRPGAQGPWAPAVTDNANAHRWTTGVYREFQRVELMNWDIEKYSTPLAIQGHLWNQDQCRAKMRFEKCDLKHHRNLYGCRFTNKLIVA